MLEDYSICNLVSTGGVGRGHSTLCGVETVQLRKRRRIGRCERPSPQLAVHAKTTLGGDLRLKDIYGVRALVKSIADNSPGEKGDRVCRLRRSTNTALQSQAFGRLNRRSKL